MSDVQELIGHIMKNIQQVDIIDLANEILDENPGISVFELAKACAKSGLVMAIMCQSFGDDFLQKEKGLSDE